MAERRLSLPQTVVGSGVAPVVADEVAKYAERGVGKSVAEKHVAKLAARGGVLWRRRSHGGEQLALRLRKTPRVGEHFGELGEGLESVLAACKGPAVEGRGFVHPPFARADSRHAEIRGTARRSFAEHLVEIHRGFVQAAGANQRQTEGQPRRDGMRDRDGVP